MRDVRVLSILLPQADGYRCVGHVNVSVYTKSGVCCRKVTSLTMAGVAIYRELTEVGTHL